MDSFLSIVASLRAAKQRLRIQLKEALKAMSNGQKRDESLVLTQKEYISANRVSVYLHMPSEEVDTTLIIKNIFDSGKTCFIPRFIGNNMDMLRVNSMDDVQSLPTYKWGIKQPAENDNARENALKTGGIDLIVVPGLGFTEDGKRLGRGKGFYDNFIGKCRELNHSTKTIALSFSVQLCDEVPTNDNDMIIDKIISP